MESNIPLLAVAAIFIVMTIGAALQGSVGYGMALISSPILIQMDPDFIPGPFILPSLILITAMIVRDKQAIDLSGLRWAILGMVPGTILGALILASFETDILVTIFALLVLVAVGLSVAGLHITRSRWVLGSAGLLSGLMGILATLSGPPIALVYQDAQGPRLRATLSGFFLVSIFFAIVSLVVVGKYGWHEIQLSLYLIPGVILGFLLSSRIVPFVDRGNTRPIILTIAALSAIIIMGKQFL